MNNTTSNTIIENIPNINVLAPIDGRIFGLDLGTTFCCLAVLDSTGRPEVIKDQLNNADTMASAIYVEFGTNEVSVGNDAKEAGLDNPSRSCQFYKRYIGRSESDMEPGKFKRFIVDDQEYSPVTLSAMAIKAIIRYAAESGYDVKNVVITCPAYFTNAQREATKLAGEEAGLNVLAVVNEPTAAAIDYTAGMTAIKDSTILVYDLGGGTFDVTLMKITIDDDGTRHMDVLGTDGDDLLGGKDWDDRLYDLYAEAFIRENPSAVQGESADKRPILPEDVAIAIRKQVEKAKWDLSKSNKEEAKIQLTYDGETLQLKVTRDEFKKATEDLMMKTVTLMNKLLKGNGAAYEDSDIDMVLLVGGSCRMPMVKEMMIARFGEDKVKFGDLDKTVARGAAIVGGIIRDEKNANYLQALTEMYAKGLIKVEGGSMTVASGANVPEEAKKIIEENSEANKQASDLIINPTPVAISNRPTIEFHDVVNNSFGIGVKEWRGDVLQDIIDNVLITGQNTPFSVERTYAVPKDDVSALIFPVIENKAREATIDYYRDDETGSMTFPDASMKERANLIVEVPVKLKAGMPINVKFSVERTGEARLFVQEPSTGTEKEITFKFFELSKDEERTMHEQLGTKRVTLAN